MLIIICWVIIILLILITYINSNIDINMMAKSNFDEDMTSSNLHKKDFRINIENLFLQV